MTTEAMEKRRGRRISLKAPLMIRRDIAGEPEERVAANVSLSGVYFETDRPYQSSEAVVVSVAVPEQQRRDFPFSRLAGRSYVVRIDELSEVEGRKRYGVALAFADNVTTLLAVPPRS